MSKPSAASPAAKVEREAKNPTATLLLDAQTRQQLWSELGRQIEDYLTNLPQIPVSQPAVPQEVRSFLAAFDFARPVAPTEAVRLVIGYLRRFQVHVSHPRYFGLFNPTPSSMGTVADALVAAFNPQLAAWKHSPFPVEVEQHLIGAMAAKLGYDPASADGTFSSGGSEANHTALLTALTHAFPEFAGCGARGLRAQPVFYVSAEAHHSLHKAARMCGIGSEAVREIAAGEDLRMDAGALEQAVLRDRHDGLAPFLIVGTAGTTNAGVIDPLPQLADIAAQERLWFHADGAWGAAAAIVPELRPLFRGIERADSITVDAHKWLFVPIAAGIYLTRHPGILEQTFHIEAAYVPPGADDARAIDALGHSMQWSRRFVGLKLFLALLVAGWEGYEAAVRHMVEMGGELRRELARAGWRSVNATPLPLVCFTDGEVSYGASAQYLDGVVEHVLASGEAWISSTRLRGTETVLRACITSYRTERKDLLRLVGALAKARAALRGKFESRQAKPVV